MALRGGRARPAALAAALVAVPELADQLRLQDEVAQRLRRRRHERGALDLETASARPVLEGGRVVALEVERTDRAQKLIEDVMITANSATAEYLDARGLPSLRRVVHAPDRWPRLMELAAKVGDRLPDEPDARAVADFLARRKAADPKGYVETCLAVRKLIGSGEYAVDVPGHDAPGHFGLAVPPTCTRRRPTAATPTSSPSACSRRP